MGIYRATRPFIRAQGLVGGTRVSMEHQVDDLNRPRLR